jgi:hypothetical protein
MGPGLGRRCALPVVTAGPAIRHQRASSHYLAFPLSSTDVLTISK